MIILEILLCLLTLAASIISVITDQRSGRVSNKVLLLCGIPGSILALCYYTLFAQDSFWLFAVNTGLCICLSWVFYATGIWGAGDSKLLLLLFMLIPARFHSFQSTMKMGGFWLYAIIFILAFGFILVDTMIQCFKKHRFLPKAELKTNWINLLQGFVFFYLLMSLSSTIIYYLLPIDLAADVSIQAAIRLLTILLGIQLLPRANRIVLVLMGAVWAVLVLFGMIQLSFQSFDWKMYLLAMLLIVIRHVAEQFNYEDISIAELKPGMILAWSSIWGFQGSRVKGLPVLTTEDLRSRLTQDEVDSILRWSNSKLGKGEITIVKKIPFAIFIAVGTIIYLCLGVWSLC